MTDPTTRQLVALAAILGLAVALRMLAHALAAPEWAVGLIVGGMVVGLAGVGWRRRK